MSPFFFLLSLLFSCSKFVVLHGFSLHTNTRDNLFSVDAYSPTPLRDVHVLVDPNEDQETRLFRCSINVKEGLLIITEVFYT